MKTHLLLALGQGFLVRALHDFDGVDVVVPQKHLVIDVFVSRELGRAVCSDASGQLRREFVESETGADARCMNLRAQRAELAPAWPDQPPTPSATPRESGRRKYCRAVAKSVCV